MTTTLQKPLTTQPFYKSRKFWFEILIFKSKRICKVNRQKITFGYLLHLWFLFIHYSQSQEIPLLYFHLPGYIHISFQLWPLFKLILEKLTFISSIWNINPFTSLYGSNHHWIQAKFNTLELIKTLLILLPALILTPCCKTFLY